MSELAQATSESTPPPASSRAKKKRKGKRVQDAPIPFVPVAPASPADLAEKASVLHQELVFVALRDDLTEISRVVRSFIHRIESDTVANDLCSEVAQVVGDAMMHIADAGRTTPAMKSSSIILDQCDEIDNVRLDLYTVNLAMKGTVGDRDEIQAIRSTMLQLERRVRGIATAIREVL